MGKADETFQGKTLIHFSLSNSQEFLSETRSSHKISFIYEIAPVTKDRVHLVRLGYQIPVSPAEEAVTFRQQWQVQFQDLKRKSLDLVFRNISSIMSYI